MPLRGDAGNAARELAAFDDGVATRSIMRGNKCVEAWRSRGWKSRMLIRDVVQHRVCHERAPLAERLSVARHRLLQ